MSVSNTKFLWKNTNNYNVKQNDGYTRRSDEFINAANNSHFL
jgi:hypothetical protein